MQIDWIDTFLDLAETRSFRRTAERLGLTQSTVSTRLQSLESVVGRRLFSRSRAGTDLTTDGLKFEPHARALRRGWTESLRAMDPTGEAALTLRIGMQHDLAAAHIGDWVGAFRQALPQVGFYVELDFSTQICSELATGVTDLGVIFTPKAMPDLHFESLGALRYVLVSTNATRRAELHLSTHIRAEYSPAFDLLAREALPELTAAPVASGTNVAVEGLLGSLGGSAFVLEESARALVAEGRAHVVRDVRPIDQPVYGALHLKNRTAHLHRRLLGIVRRNLTGAG